MNSQTYGRLPEDRTGVSSIPVAEAPSWAARSTVRSFARQNGAPVTCLLTEHRIHVPSRTTYSRYVNRLESSQAVQQLSRVEIPFDPEVQSLVVHAISIFRNGQLTNHARTEDFEIIRREQKLESGIVNGQVSALLLLKDVRPGDVLDLEFSMTDAGGIFGDGMSWLQSAEQAYPVGDWKFAWLDEPGRRYQCSPKPEHLEYTESMAEGLLIREWKASGIPAKEPENHLPADVFPFSYLQVSTFGSWGEVVERLLARWNFTPAAREELDIELETIRSAAGGDPAKLVDFAVASARDAVRYQSYSPGLLAMVPADLATVWNRRYGDCKEKALLLTWLLRECGLDAVPVLVNGSIGKALPGLLPGPGMFDHVVTRVGLDGKTLWIDATDLYRGGRPSGWISLPLAWGLPLAPGESDLVEIPDAGPGETYLKVREHVKPDSATRSVAVEAELVAGGRRADWLRGLMDSQGMQGLQKFLKSYMETTRRGIELSGDPSFDDDREKNEIVIRVSTRIPQGVQQDPEYARDRVSLAPFTFAGMLPVSETSTRAMPLFLGTADRIEHEIEVEHPAVTKADYPRQTARTSAFQVDVGSRMAGPRPVFWFSCSILEDRVAPADLTKYKAAVDRAYGILDVCLHLPAKGRRSGSAHPERRWGGGIPSRAAHAGQATGAMRIVWFVCLGIVILSILIRLIAALAG